MILECEKEKKKPSRTTDFEEQLKVRGAETTTAAETTDLNMWKGSGTAAPLADEPTEVTCEGERGACDADEDNVTSLATVTAL